MNTVNDLLNTFKETFGQMPLVVQAPGRINIIGEHTDYNEGYVLPAAINRFAYVAIQINDSKTCNVYAKDLNESFSFSLNESLKPALGGWKNIILGVTNEFIKRGAQVSGYNVILTSNVPVGSGMSSSAAIESAFGFGMNEIFRAGFDKEEIGLIGQQAEHLFVGVKCGIMDQFASVFGRKDQVVKIDCRTQEREYFPADFGDYQVVLIDSKVKHELVSSGYNMRRQQCEAGVEKMRKNNSIIAALRDATLNDLNAIREEVESTVLDRCKYVIEENARVLEACSELTANNINRVGHLMYETHDGLSNLYEVSCDELDLLVSLAKREEAVIGSRMMGGGFGGCTINLIKRDMVKEVSERILLSYKTETRNEAAVYKLNIADGAKTL